MLAMLIGVLLSAQAPPPTDAIDDYVRSEMSRRRIPGLALAVIRRGKLAKAKGYGWANVELSVAASSTTLLQIASITKLFTATAVMALVEDGKLGLDDRISDHLRGLPAAWQDVTVRHLLAHTSGIKDFTDVKTYQESRSQDRTFEQIVDLVADAPLDFIPGSEFRYSNTGYVLLGKLIESLSGTGYGSFLRARIFDPLGMTRTRVNDLRAVIEDRAQGYTWRERELSNAEAVSPATAGAAGGLVASVTDLATWDVAFFGGKVIRSSTIDRMLEGSHPLGWEVDTVNGHVAFEHAGDIIGFSSQLEHFRDDSLTVIVLVNASGVTVGSRKIARGVSALLVPALAPKREPAIPDPMPNRTERLRQLAQHLFIDGAPDEVLLSDEMKRRTTPAFLEANRRFHALFGRLTALELLERTEADAGVMLRYRAVFEGETARLFVRIDRAGTVTALALQGEPPY